MIPRKVGRMRSLARHRMRPSEAPPPGAEASAGLQPLFWRSHKTVPWLERPAWYLPRSRRLHRRAARTSRDAGRKGTRSTGSDILIAVTLRQRSETDMRNQIPLRRIR
jgi:hypothetical protein